MEKQERIGKYLCGVYYGVGYVSIDKLARFDIKYDPDLKNSNITVEEVISQAIKDGFKIQLRRGEWCLVMGRDY